MLNTIPDFLDQSERERPQKVGLIFGEKKFTYSQIKKNADFIANKLSKISKRGDIIGILLPNSPDFIFSYFGILKSGCIALLIPTNISDENLEYQLKKTTPIRVIFCQPYENKLIRIQLPKKTKIINIGEFLEEKEDRKFLARRIKRNDIASIVFTSGSTSMSKGVKLKHSNVVQATKNIIEFLKFNEKDIDVNISSLSHSFGLGHLHCIFAVGGTQILFKDSVNLKKILETIIKERATTFSAVPTILHLITQHFPQIFSKCDKYLRFIQTNISTLDQSLVEKIFTLLPNTDFHYYYGLTEASRSTFITLNKNKRKLTSIGKASPNVRIKIVDKKGKKLLAGKVGEICIKGKHVISGYFKDNRISKRRIKNGWLHTGDLGLLDKDGYLYFYGRKDDVINVAGEKVSPEEIEYRAKTVPGVVDAVAVGQSDKLFGEVAKLYVAVNKNSFKMDKLVISLKKNLERYKNPMEIEIIDKVPRTDNGKLMRWKLKTYG